MSVIEISEIISLSLFSSSFQCCVFSSRLMGRGYYVFDRRWNRMRLALQNMVEKHLNAQMWRSGAVHKQLLMLIHNHTTLSDDAVTLECLCCPLLADCGQSTSSTFLSPNKNETLGSITVIILNQEDPTNQVKGVGGNL